jgi:hypothetical protein
MEKADHPVYGKIEIGGFNKNFGRIHPGFLLESDAHRNAAFCIYNAWVTPRLEISAIIGKELPGGLKEVTATITNTQMMPTHSEQTSIPNRTSRLCISGRSKVLAG